MTADLTRFGRDAVVTTVTQAASVWMSPGPPGERWRQVAELHGRVALAHLAHGEPLLPLVAFTDLLTGSLSGLPPDGECGSNGSVSHSVVTEGAG
ncbi:hypothetical protein [Micromonospora sp. WMMA1947]|uniref:hypothetical protein n=1 Tax=Micromonospora sp. WMMA1947 TaxID=3015163 RepID=UPI00248B4292|nr:hypothetical protein [Micromonospora sp. WMMA1947]WBC10508.1 hypothetical protein O7604_06435 [Micromonospora sp. WMMA1947]